MIARWQCLLPGLCISIQRLWSGLGVMCNPAQLWAGLKPGYIEKVATGRASDIKSWYGMLRSLCGCYTSQPAVIQWGAWAREFQQRTSSSAVAERPRDALCPSVVSLNKNNSCGVLLSLLRLQIYHCHFNFNTDSDWLLGRKAGGVMWSVVLPFCKQDNLRSPKQLIIQDCARRFVLKLYRHEASRGLVATAELLVTIHGETTFADKRMNPVHFESITVNRHIRVIDSKYGTFNDIFLPFPLPLGI